ncbi:hypothetical protein K474DRAFT_1379504 [Panus rudis PR-1116 ss-1]|nr:hypothetical protein K474DRAFT_1379504 [Panus rudis PR-1116 ss-1]
MLRTWKMRRGQRKCAVGSLRCSIGRACIESSVRFAKKWNPTNDVLLTPETEQRSLSEEQCVEVTMLCDALHTMLTSCSHSRFTLSAYMVSIIRLHRYVNYLLLIASPQSLLRKYLDQPPDIVVVPTASSYSVTVDVSPATLFPLLTEAVGYTDPPLTSEYVTQRLYAESPQLVGKSEITVEGTAHCEARLAVYIFDRFTVASHMGLSSIPCYACSRFISACRETFGYFTLTFDQSFREEFDLPWVLPPPFREDGGYSGQENISLTNMIWEHMCTRISDDLEVLWSEEGQEELAAYKRYLRRSKAREE